MKNEKEKPKGEVLAEEKEEDNAEEQEEDEETLVDKANTAAKRIEDANAEQKKLLDRQERMAADAALGGKAEAGTPQMTKEQKSAETAKKLLEGSGMDPFADEGKAALE